jgi:hypothetical protein
MGQLARITLEAQASSQAIDSALRAEKRMLTLTDYEVYCATHEAPAEHGKE